MAKRTFIYFLLLQWLLFSSVHGLGLTYFHCRTATCQDFYYGLRNFPHLKNYVNVCHQTVDSLQEIATEYGKCFDEITQKLNPNCIQALARTIHTCVKRLNGVPELAAKYFCGYRLMQNCARHVGLDRFPSQTDYRYPYQN